MSSESRNDETILRPCGLGGGARRDSMRGKSHHLLHVLRGEPGYAVEVFDGRGGRGSGVLNGREGKRAVVRIESTSTEPAEPEFVLATAVPKGRPIRVAVEKATELGVSRLVPLVTRRSVVDPPRRKTRQAPHSGCRGVQTVRSVMAHAHRRSSLAGGVRAGAGRKPEPCAFAVADRPPRRAPSVRSGPAE